MKSNVQSILCLFTWGRMMLEMLILDFIYRTFLFRVSRTCPSWSCGHKFDFEVQFLKTGFVKVEKLMNIEHCSHVMHINPTACIRNHKLFLEYMLPCTYIPYLSKHLLKTTQIGTKDVAFGYEF